MIDEHDDELSNAQGREATDDDSVETQDERSERIRAALKSRRLSFAKLAIQLGCNKQDVSNWIAGDYSHVAKKALTALDHWLDSLGIESYDAPDEPEFVDTDTSKGILNTLRYCHARGEMGAVHGAPGVGKTLTAQRYRDEWPKNVFILTACPEISTVHPMLEALAATLGLEEMPSGKYGMKIACRNRLAQAKKPLLVVDEAQHLGKEALESLRSLFDEVGFGWVLMGNPRVYDRLTGGGRYAEFAQLFSRLAIVTAVKGSSRKDVYQIVKSWGIIDKEACEALYQISRRNGALRMVHRVASLAIAAAGGVAANVGIEHVRLAAKNLGVEVVI